LKVHVVSVERIDVLRRLTGAGLAEPCEDGFDDLLA
jgi:hypothetical protein